MHSIWLSPILQFLYRSYDMSLIQLVNNEIVCFWFKTNDIYGFLVILFDSGSLLAYNIFFSLPLYFSYFTHSL